MVLTLKPNMTQEEINEILRLLKREGLNGRVVQGEIETIVAVIGDETNHLDFLRGLENHPSVVSFTMISNPYKVISRAAYPNFNGDMNDGYLVSNEIRAGPLVVGGRNKLALIAGPCSVDAKEKGLNREVAQVVRDLGGRGLRGGAYKPRTLPYDFRGQGEPALALGREIADEYGLAFVTEPVRSRHIGMVLKYAHVVQIGTRNANQGFYLDVAEMTAENKTPILAKRGMGQLLEEEYLPLVVNIYDFEGGGNPNVMLCLRGIRDFNRATRFTLDAGDVPVLKRKTILPVVGDPSHAAGLEMYVVDYAKMLIAGGVDGLLVEVYPDGKKSLSDSAQAINYKGLEQIVNFAKRIGRM